MPREPQADDRGLAQQRQLIRALRDPACYPHDTHDIAVIETHISYVILTGAVAYKVKKAVDLGFLDFTTLEKRQFFCREELRLNARLAPEIYRDVVAIGGSLERPSVGAGAQPLEYAVKMIQFAQECQADRALARRELAPRHFDALAARLARFHAAAPCAQEGDGFGAPGAILAASAQNFAQVREFRLDDAERQQLDQVEDWARREFDRVRGQLAGRKRAGRVRECHGDLHLGNLVLLRDALQPFDCIEFNPDLRWIDVISEIAFLLMDLDASGRPDLARGFLNSYLESGGDYEGLRVLAWYFAYRAMVRAKIGLMRAAQVGSAGDIGTLRQGFRRYLALAAGCARPQRGFIAITHGFSGSGKTTLSQPLVELTGAIRIRSDIERKRMHGVAATEHGESGIAGGLYSADVTDATYRRLLDVVQPILESGRGVLVDATFLKRRHRDLFRDFAAQAGVAFAIVDFTAPESVLRGRIAARARLGADASDADQAVLQHQIRSGEALQADELGVVFGYDASRPVEQARMPETWAELIDRLSPRRA